MSLSPESKALLEQARAERFPPQAKLTAAHVSLSQRLDTSDRPVIVWTPRMVMVALLIMSLLVASSVAAYNIIRAWSSAPAAVERTEQPATDPIAHAEPQADPVERAVVPQQAPADEPSVEPSELPTKVAPEAVSAQKSPRSKRATQRVQAPAAEDTEALPSALVEETRLLAQAQQAIRGHDPQKALGFLNEHSRRFPQGTLALERRAAELVARCQLGRTETLRGRAAAFVERHPGSVHASRVRATCLP